MTDTTREPRKRGPFVTEDYGAARERKWPPRIGMPGYLYLNAFADVASDFFGVVAYHVGSSAAHKNGGGFRDVDVRVMLPDEQYVAEGYEHIGGAPLGTKWSAACLAFTALGEKMTGLPIDFQVQSVSDGNLQEGARWALGLRFTDQTHRRRSAGRRVPYLDVDSAAAYLTSPAEPQP